MKNVFVIFLVFICSVLRSNATVTMLSVRSMYSGTPVILPANTIVEGQVISDFTGLNCNALNMYIQDNTGGLVMRFLGPHTYGVGSILTIDVSGLTLKAYKDLVEVDSIPLTAVSVTGTVTVSPAIVTIADILNNMNGGTDTWEATLVTIKNATITGTAGTYSGQDTITDATGSMALYTFPVATFATTTFPSGLVNITGVITDYQTLPEINIRQTSDVVVVSGIAQNNSEALDFKVIENPVHGMIRISYSKTLPSSTYILTDITGKVCRTGLIESNSEGSSAISVAGLKRGIYLLVIGSPETTTPVKISIE